MKLVNGGLKNLRKSTETVDKNIKKTNAVVSNLKILATKFLVIRTKNSLYKTLFSHSYPDKLLEPIRASSTDFAACLPSLIAHTTSD